MQVKGSVSAHKHVAQTTGKPSAITGRSVFFLLFPSHVSVYSVMKYNPQERNRATAF